MPKRDSKLFTSNNSKMAGAYNWNLPPVKTCPGALFVPGAVCEKCYGCNGNYLYPAAQKHFETQMKLAHSLELTAILANELMRLLTKHGTVRLRIHPTGDFFSSSYATKWFDALRYVTREIGNDRTRKLHVWAATKSWDIFEILPVLQDLNSLRNVVIRPSAKMVDEPAPDVPGLSGGAAVSRTKNTCPAIAQHTSCQEAGCLRCWTNRNWKATFKLH